MSTSIYTHNTSNPHKKSTKMCSKCKISKDIDLFPLDNSRKDGHGYHCSSCRNIISHDVYKRTHPTVTDYAPRSGGRNFNRNEYNKEYRTKDLPRNAAYSAKRRAQKMKATPKWYEHDKIIELYKLAGSMGLTDDKVYHVDHIVPLQSNLVCGLHCFDNLQILEDVENLKKHNKFSDI